MCYDWSSNIQSLKDLNGNCRERLDIGDFFREIDLDLCQMYTAFEKVARQD